MKRPDRSKSQDGVEVRQRPTSSARVASEFTPEQFLRLPSGSCPVWETPVQVADAADSASETPTWRKRQRFSFSFVSQTLSLSPLHFVFLPVLSVSGPLLRSYRNGSLWFSLFGSVLSPGLNWQRSRRSMSRVQFCLCFQSTALIHSLTQWFSFHD